MFQLVPYCVCIIVMNFNMRISVLRVLVILSVDSVPRENPCLTQVRHSINNLTTQLKYPPCSSPARPW